MVLDEIRKGCKDVQQCEAQIITQFSPLLGVGGGPVSFILRQNATVNNYYQNPIIYTLS